MYQPRTGTTPTDSRRAQDRLAMPAPKWLPDGPLIEYGRPPYGSPPAHGIRRGAICKTAGSHVGADTSSHIFGHDQTAPGQRGVLRELSCTHLGLWGFEKKQRLYQKVIACLHQKKKGGIRGGKLFFCPVFDKKTKKQIHIFDFLLSL